MTKLQCVKLRPHGINAIRGTRHTQHDNMYNYLFTNMKI